MYYTTKNYTINATLGKLTIKPATFNENSIKITAYSGTYDGSEHPVIKEISVYPAGSTVEYSTETGSSNWNTTCPKVKNVSDSKKQKYGYVSAKIIMSHGFLVKFKQQSLQHR